MELVTQDSTKVAAAAVNTSSRRHFCNDVIDKAFIAKAWDHAEIYSTYSATQNQICLRSDTLCSEHAMCMSEHCSKLSKICSRARTVNKFPMKVLRLPACLPFTMVAGNQCVRSVIGIMQEIYIQVLVLFIKIQVSVSGILVPFLSVVFRQIYAG